MAYIQDANDPNQPQEQLQDQGLQPQTAMGGGSGAIGAPQGAASTPNASKAPPVQDLKAYLEANAPQAVQMGQNIANKLGQQAQAVTGNIDTTKNTLGQQIEAQNVTPNTELINQAASNPSQFVTNDQNVQDFLRQRDANYTGPANFQATPDSQRLTTEVANAQANAPDINKPGGVQQLVRGQAKNPTQGMANLDTLVLQGNPNAISPIKNVLPQFANLDEYLAAAQGGINNQIQQVTQNAEAARENVQDRFLTGENAVIPAFQEDVNRRYQDNVGKVNSYNNSVNSLFGLENAANPLFQNVKNSTSAYNQALSNNLNIPIPTGRTLQDQLMAFALNTMHGWGQQPLSVGEIQNPSTVSQPTLGQSVTQDDTAKQSALDMLLGDQFNPFFDATGATPFQDPGANPTVQSVFNPVMVALKNQLNSAHAIMNDFTKPIPQGNSIPSTDYLGNISSDMAALQQYLESH